MFIAFFKDLGGGVFSGLPGYLARMPCVFFAALMLVLPLHAQDDAKNRVALVIGNGAYQNVPELRNPRNDSEDLAKALTAIGFEVLLHTDQTQGTMLDTLRGFRRLASA